MSVFCRHFVLGLLLCIWVLSIFEFGLSAQEATSGRRFPRIVARKEFLAAVKKGGFLKEADDIWSWERLLELSLDASGVSREEHPRYRAIVQTYIHDLKKLLEPLDTDYERGEEILRYMFGFLTRYEALQTRLDVLFQNGIFNCVSSAALYLVLSRALGFEAMGVGTYDHAFVNLIGPDGRNIYVETTSKYGFDPGYNKEFMDSFTSTTGLVYVPKNKYRESKLLSDAEFVSLILQNRLYVLNQSNQNYRVLEQMIPLAADLATLTQAEQDIQDFFSMVSQYSFNLSQSGQVDQSLEFTDVVLQTYGEREILREIRNVIAYNSVLSLVEKGEYLSAEKRLANFNAKQLLNKQNQRKLLGILQKKQLENIVNSSSLSFETKLIEVKGLAEGDILSRGSMKEVYQVLYGNELNLLLRNKKFDKAAKILANYPKTLRDTVFFHKMESSVENTHVINIYNQSVARINAGAYRDAERILTTGLNFYPDNLRLLQLRTKLSQIEEKAS